MDLKHDRKLLRNFLEGNRKIKLEPIERAPPRAPKVEEAKTSEKKPKTTKPTGTPSERIRSYMKSE